MAESQRATGRERDTEVSEDTYRIQIPQPQDTETQKQQSYAEGSSLLAVGRRDGDTSGPAAQQTESTPLPPHMEGTQNGGGVLVVVW